MEKRVEITKGAAETQQLAKDLIKELLKEKKRKKAMVIGLEGELGSGKTTFIQSIAKELNIKELVASPTFVIFKKYAVSSPSVRWFYHFDCYRIGSEKDILDLGFKEIISQPENLVMIEWSEKIKKILSKDCLIIRFSHLGEDKRRIEISYAFDKLRQ